MDSLDPDDVRPPYLQVASAIRGDIEDGSYKLGDKLPPHQAIAEQYGVSVGTVKRAYGLLQQERLIITRQGQGSFVRSKPAQEEAAGETGDLAEVYSQLASIRRRLDVLERELREVKAR